jgi:hypothetical protein
MPGIPLNTPLPIEETALFPLDIKKAIRTKFYKKKMQFVPI